MLVNILDIGYALTVAVTAPWWMRKSRSGWDERFARVVPDLPAKTPGRLRIMLHAVSVGEVNALRELVPMLAAEAEVVVTASTDTGIARARDLFGEVCHVARFPLDASWMVRRFLDAVDPDAVGLVELELWPNFVRECVRRSVPIAVVNGRLSERSFKGYKRIARWISPSFASLTVAAVQDETYAGRFYSMGVPRERVVVTGSMKFDSARMEDDVEGADQLARDLGIDRSRPLIVAGSTGPGEEALLCEACTRAFGEGEVQLLCAPRKTERFDEAARAMPGCIRRTKRATTTDDSKSQNPALQCGVGCALIADPVRANPEQPPTEVGGSEAVEGGRPPSLFLLDTIGELRQAYSLADVVVVGRSFFDLHGSDPIEPIALGRPTVIGSSVSDFVEIVRALEDAGGLLRADRATLGETLVLALRDAKLRRGLVERGRACIGSLQGASARHSELLLWLAEGGGDALSEVPVELPSRECG